MKKTITLMLCLLALSLLCSCVHTSGPAGSASVAPVIDRILKRGELIVGTAGDMPPMNMRNKEGRIIGFEADMAQYIADAMGVKLNLMPIPFYDLLSALESGVVDMVLSQVTITGQRNLKVAFVGPYFTSGKSLLTKLETIAAIKDASELNSPDFTLVALKGSTSEVFAQTVVPKAKLVPAKNYDEAVQMVLEDKVHALIADHPICMISPYRYPDQGLLFLITPLTYEQIGVALPANDPLLVNWMENFINTLKGSGELNELEARWLENGSWLKELK